MTIVGIRGWLVVIGLCLVIGALLWWRAWRGILGQTAKLWPFLLGLGIGMGTGVLIERRRQGGKRSARQGAEVAPTRRRDPPRLEIGVACGEPRQDTQEEELCICGHQQDGR